MQAWVASNNSHPPRLAPNMRTEEIPTVPAMDVKTSGLWLVNIWSKALNKLDKERGSSSEGRTSFLGFMFIQAF
jgi:hypothetical protein